MVAVNNFAIGILCILAPLAVAVAALAWHLWRGRPRRCCECRFPMTLLGHDVAEHLGETEQLEVAIGSAGFEVWACQSCGHVAKLRRHSWSTEYSVCPQCSARTKSSTERTVEPATDYSFGEVLIIERCENCDYRQERTHVTPMIDDESWHRAS